MGKQHRQRALSAAEHAAIGLIRARDWVTIPELQDGLKPFMGTVGDHHLFFEAYPMGIFWAALSPALVMTILSLTDRGYLAVVPVSRAVYERLGMTLTFPVFDATQRPLNDLAGVSSPHWVPVALRLRSSVPRSLT